MSLTNCRKFPEPEVLMALQERTQANRTCAIIRSLLLGG